MRKQIRNTLTLAGAVVSLFGLAGGVQAAPVTYNFTSGSATLSLTSPLVGSLLAPASTVGLTGTQVTFDATALTVNSFQFADAGPSNISGAGVLAGTTVTITNLNIIPGGGYSSTAVGTNPYNYLVGPVAVSGTYALSGAIVQGPTAFSSVNPSLAGLITLGGVTSLSLSGITLGTFTLPAALGPPLAGQSATLKADILFSGVVPVPAAVWLFGSGLGLLGVMRRRVA